MSVAAAGRTQVPAAVMPSSVMLVSALASPAIQREIRDGLRPLPEYRLLADRYGVEIFDWSRAGGHAHRRTALHTLRQVTAFGLSRLRNSGVIFSDGEHLGIPIAAAKALLGIETPQVTIGHRLTSIRKRRLLELRAIRDGIDRVVVHSNSQLRAAASIGLSPALVPYGIDTSFWSPIPSTEGALILSPGREQRDHRTLANACRGINARVVITAASAHSAGARMRKADPSSAVLERRVVSYGELRRLYAAASLVVIPLLDADFPAGVTTLLEAMAMGKAIVVSGTEGLADYVQNGETALAVPAVNPDALRDAIDRLLTNPAERVELGRRAREVALSRYGLQVYASRLFDVIVEAGRAHP